MTKKHDAWLDIFPYIFTNIDIVLFHPALASRDCTKVAASLMEIESEHGDDYSMYETSRFFLLYNLS